MSPRRSLAEVCRGRPTRPCPERPACAGALYRKGTLRIDISDSNEDDFIKNLLTIRVEERAAFAVYQPTGFASVTGLVAAP